MDIGVIDIGSNSIKMIIANTDNGLIIKKQLKDYVTLNKKENNMLTEVKINEAVTTLIKFKKVCNNLSNLIIVATEAVRSAKNQIEFVERVKKSVGLDIRVLKGSEEAYYDYLATINSINIENHDLIIDIGGGSTELILVKNEKIERCISVPFGVVSLTELFNPNDKNNTNQEYNLKEYVNNYFDKLDWINKAKGNNIIGIGGSITNIGSIHLENNNNPAELLHSHSIPFNEFKRIYQDLKNMTEALRLNVAGLAKEEVNYVIVAAQIVNILIDKLEIKNITFSKNGVREGIVYEQIEG